MIRNGSRKGKNMVHGKSRKRGGINVVCVTGLVYLTRSVIFGRTEISLYICLTLTSLLFAETMKRSCLIFGLRRRNNIVSEADDVPEVLSLVANNIE